MASPRPLPPRDGPSPGPGGIIHTYLGYDPRSFPSPTAPPPDIAGAAFEHMLAHGSLRRLTEEELASAVHIDPSQIAGLGPSLDALLAMLEDRKRKILETYETNRARRAALDEFKAAAARSDPPATLRDRFDRLVKDEQVRDLERLWFRLGDDTSPFAQRLMKTIESLAARYQVEQLSGKYDFTGREPMSVPKALAIKEELEAIDRLIEQIKEAMKAAQLAIIDFDALSEFAKPQDIENLEGLQKKISEFIRQQAELQGLEQSAGGYQLTPKAYGLFQAKLLAEIFSDLEASRSGRHQGPITGEGVVELQRTRPYEFGDAASAMDVTGSVINALVRQSDNGTKHRKSDAGTAEPASPHSVTSSLRHSVTSSDLLIHHTRNNPKCATCVLMDMSGSMRYDGQYINVKRMALGLDALIKREYPGDFLNFIEIYSLAKLRPAAEIAALLPRPVSIHQPVVRLRADMSRPDASESAIPQHFTNIQRGLQLARQLLGAQDTPNRQVILITDGLPTAHFEAQHLYLLYPPDPLTERATMREAAQCRRENITINIFLLPSWSQSSDDVAFAHRMAESTKGRVFFTGGRDLDRFVLWDYVNQRRKIIA